MISEWLRARRSPARKRRRRLRPPRSLRATRAGWCYVAIIFGVGFAALNTGNNLLYLVLAGMLGFLVLSGLLSEAALRGIVIERRRLSSVHAHAEHRVVLRVRNDQRRVAAFAVSIEDRLDESDARPAAGRTFALRVGPGETLERSYVWEPERRGEHAFAGFRVSTRFPFGLFVKSLELDHPGHALVYPAIVPRSLSTDARAAGSHAAPSHARTAAGDDVSGLRDFVPGDSMRRVHWRRTLRANRLLVGERDGEVEGELEVELRLQDDVDGPPEAHEDAISAAASDVVHHLDAGLRVGLRTATFRVPPEVGAAHRAELLARLARLDVEETLHAQRGEDRPAADDEPASLAASARRGAETGTRSAVGVGAAR